MTTDEARARAERIFKQEERDREGRVAMSDYETRGRAIRENMARLRAIRLATQAKTGTDRGTQLRRVQEKLMTFPQRLPSPNRLPYSNHIVMMGCSPWSSIAC